MKSRSKNQVKPQKQKATKQVDAMVIVHKRILDNGRLQYMYYDPKFNSNTWRNVEDCDEQLIQAYNIQQELEPQIDGKKIIQIISLDVVGTVKYLKIQVEEEAKPKEYPYNYVKLYAKNMVNEFMLSIII